ncbi:helix-turn-helix domain-containing protein [Bacillus wiedmannii]|uniref:helix-turn-helix domain-containing protein n=1 Tax=Bacillus wiedmannii TaxID=1890302 RepID=UPI000BF81985|nr:helix-turn-helix domain-containing protein [Bacillus wiedmannii]PGD90319.1 hypothetical protein COM48_27910 [Bacillus wiedmannii]
MERFFSKSLTEKRQIFNDLRESYSDWRDELHEMNKPFFMIHSDFKYQYLKEISGGALKLFVFLGLHSKYNTGESWYTIEEVSRFFEKDQRTVAKWFKELEDMGIIFRGQTGFNRKANTFLRPYGFVFELTFNTINVVDDVLNTIEYNTSLGRKTMFGVLFNFNFKEYTFVLLNQDEQLYKCSCFLNFDYEELKDLKNRLKNIDIAIDNFDIDVSIMNSGNPKLTIYNSLLKYFDEEQI